MISKPLKKLLILVVVFVFTGAISQDAYSQPGLGVSAGPMFVVRGFSTPGPSDPYTFSGRVFFDTGFAQIGALAWKPIPNISRLPWIYGFLTVGAPIDPPGDLGNMNLSPYFGLGYGGTIIFLAGGCFTGPVQLCGDFVLSGENNKIGQVAGLNIGIKIVFD